MAQPSTFDAASAWRLSPQVSLRDESFGALAYHHGNRRLVFLKSRGVVELVRSLERFPSAATAIAAATGPESARSLEVALSSLAKSGVICGD